MLQQQGGVDYLAVASADEGVLLGANGDMMLAVKERRCRQLR